MIHMNQLLAHILAGGLGAGLGSGLGFLLPKGKLRKNLSPIGPVLGFGLATLMVSLLLPPPGIEERLAAELDAIPVYQLAVRDQPSLKGQYLARMHAANKRGGEQAATAEALAISREIGVAYMPKLLSKTSDAALDDFTAATNAYLTRAYEHDPDGCYTWAKGHRAGVKNPDMTPMDTRRFTAAMTKVVDAAVKHPVTISKEELAAGTTKLQEIGASIGEAEGSMLYLGDYNGQPATTPAQRKGACLFMTRVYQQIAAVPPPLRFLALRSLFAR